jgi:hypothetical protein
MSGAASPEARAASDRANAANGAAEVSEYDEQHMGRHTMRRLHIVIPYVQGGLADETRVWGESMRAEFVDLTGDDEGYFKLMTRLLNERHEFYICEQDIVPNAQQFTDMVACPREWCAGWHKTDDIAEPTWSLGLMKFGRQLVNRHFNLLHDGNTEPDAADMLAQVMSEGRGPDGIRTPPDRRWQKVDLALYTVIGMAAVPRTETHNAHLLAIPALDARSEAGTIQPHLHGPHAQHLAKVMQARRGLYV